MLVPVYKALLLKRAGVQRRTAGMLALHMGQIRLVIRRADDPMAGARGRLERGRCQHGVEVGRLDHHLDPAPVFEGRG